MKKFLRQLALCLAMLISMCGLWRVSVTAAPTLKITTEILPKAVAGEAYTAKILCNEPNAVFAISSAFGRFNDFGKTGLILSEDGTISGTPTEPGIYRFSIVATGAEGGDYRVYTLVVEGTGETTEPTTEPEAPTTEPVTTEPVTEPITTEPVTEPLTTEPITEPITTEPVTEPLTTEPITEPITTEPVTEPVTTEPITEPVTTEPAIEPETTTAEPETAPTEATPLEPAASQIGPQERSNIVPSLVVVLIGIVGAGVTLILWKKE